MPDNPINNGHYAARPNRNASAGEKAEPDLCRRRAAETLERLLKQERDPLHRQYLMLFFDPAIHSSLVAETKDLAGKMQRRQARGSDEFQHQPNDLINHAMMMICQSRRVYATKQEFKEDFVRKLDNYDRSNRRSQPSKIKRDESSTVENAQSVAYEAKVFSFVRPDEAAEFNSDINALVHAVGREAPELLPLLTAMRRGMLKPAELVDYLKIELNDCNNQRARLRRIANRVLGER